MDAEWQQTPDLQDFLLQSSDEEDVPAEGFELSDPQLDSEAEVMAYFDKNQTNNAQQPDEMSSKYSAVKFSFSYEILPFYRNVKLSSVGQSNENSGIE